MTDLERALFEVAIYRLSWDEWAVDLNHRVERRLNAVSSRYEREGLPLTNANRQRELATAKRIERPHAWDYNEIVAWVRILADCSTAKGYLFKVERERFYPGFKPYPFDYGYPASKVIEEWLERDTDDNLAVYQRLRAALLGLTAPGSYLPGRHVDLRVFDTIGPFVDWWGVISGERPAPG